MTRIMMGIQLFVVLLSCLGATSAALGQSILNPERANSVTSLLGNKFDPWKNPDRGIYAPRSPGDSDLGEQRILTPSDSYLPFNLLLTEQALWTDNAALTDGGELSDFYSNTALRLSYLPQVAANTYGEISAGYSFYRYADHSALDFDSLEASLGIIHVFRELNDLSTWLRYNHTRLLSARGHNELFTDHSIELGLYYPISLGPRHFAYGALSSEFSLEASPGYVGRHEHGVTLGYEFKPTDRISLSSYYRVFLRDYRERSRDDVLHTLGLAVSTRLTEKIDLVLSASYSLNDSDLPGNDYEVGEAGAILSLKFEL